MPWFEIAILLLIPLVVHLFKFKFNNLCVALDDTGVDNTKPEMRWIHEVELPRYARKRIQKHFDSFIQAGFKHLGYFEVKHRFVTMYDCYFESDGSLIAEISISKAPLVPATIAIAAKSILKDGTLVETSHKASIPSSIATIANKRYLHITCAGTTDPSELCSFHLQELNQLLTHDNSFVPLDEDLIPEITEYGLNLVDHYLHDEGVLPKKPTAFYESSKTKSDDSNITELVNST